MQSNRPAIGGSTVDLLALRGGERVDVSPVLAIDELARSAWPAWTEWVYGGSQAGVAAAFTYVTLANMGPHGSFVVIDRIRMKAGAAGSLYGILGTVANLGGALGIPNQPAVATKIDTDATSASLAAFVMASGANTGTSYTNFLWEPREDAGPLELPFRLVLASQMMVALKWSTQNTLLNWAASGRYYDPL